MLRLKRFKMNLDKNTIQGNILWTGEPPEMLADAYFLVAKAIGAVSDLKQIGEAEYERLAKIAEREIALFYYGRQPFLSSAAFAKMAEHCPPVSVEDYIREIEASLSRDDLYSEPVRNLLRKTVAESFHAAITEVRI